MEQLIYSRDELLAEHDYARPHEVAGYALHGGFDADDVYVSPRTLHRWPAVRAWRRELARRGGALLDADRSLLREAPYPSHEQHGFLLRHGLGQSLWSSLTITGVIEARGRLLIDLPAPDFQRVIEDDLASTAVGHLNIGLLTAHGMDEGGDPRSRLGAHDQMWFAVRDLAFGKDAYPIPEIASDIARPDGGRLAPRLPLAHEQMLTLLMNVLMIEIRAAVVFDLVERLLGDPELFPDTRRGAELGVTMVGRIRTDESIHVAYLQTVLSEMRTFTWKAIDGGRLAGADVIDPMWETLVRWHAVENPRLQRQVVRPVLHGRLAAHRDAERLIRELDALEAPLAS